MALRLRFQSAGSGPIWKGPYESVVFEGGTVREQPGGPVIAAHLPHGWTVDGEDFERLDVDPPVVVSWEGFPGAPSTTGHLSWANGIAYIDRRMFAVVDQERRDWYLVREAQHHPILVLQSLP